MRWEDHGARTHEPVPNPAYCMTSGPSRVFGGLVLTGLALMVVTAGLHLSTATVPSPQGEWWANSVVTGTWKVPGLPGATSSLSVSMRAWDCGTPGNETGGYIPSGIEACVDVHVTNDGANVDGATVSLSDSLGDTFSPLSPTQGWVTDATGTVTGTFETPVVASSTDSISARAVQGSSSGLDQASLQTGAESATLTVNMTGECGNGGSYQGGSSIEWVADVQWEAPGGGSVGVQGALVSVKGSDGVVLTTSSATPRNGEVFVAFTAPSPGIGSSQTYDFSVVAQMLGYTLGTTVCAITIFGPGAAPGSSTIWIIGAVVAVAIVAAIVFEVRKRRKRRERGPPPPIPPAVSRPPSKT